MERLLAVGIFMCWTGIHAGGNASLFLSREKHHSLNEAPQDERALYVEFILRTRANRKTPEKGVFVGGHPPVFKNYDPEKETVILIPGATVFGQGYSFYFTSFFSYAFLKNGDCNVISVQWNHLVDLNLLKQTLQNAAFVGELTAALIDFLRSDSRKTNVFNVIGHHDGTIAAATASALVKRKLERLTALDPQEVPPNVRLPHWAQLGRSCAEVVEVVHTSGYTPAMGHRDFYPNGGVVPQPGCLFDFFDYCSSERAFLLYGTDVILGGNHYNATICQTYEKYINHECDNRETISLWNRENSYSFPAGSYFFQTIPELEQQQPTRRYLQSRPREPQRYNFPRYGNFRFSHWTSF